MKSFKKQIYSAVSALLISILVDYVYEMIFKNKKENRGQIV